MHSRLEEDPAHVKAGNLRLGRSRSGSRTTSSTRRRCELDEVSKQSGQDRQLATVPMQIQKQRSHSKGEQVLVDAPRAPAPNRGLLLLVWYVDYRICRNFVRFQSKEQCGVRVYTASIVGR
jgi:hypothetical protein